MEILDNTPQKRVQVKVRQYKGTSSVQGTEEPNTGRVINLTGCTASEVCQIISTALRTHGATTQRPQVDPKRLQEAMQEVRDLLLDPFSSQTEAFACLKAGVTAIRVSELSAREVVDLLLTDSPAWAVLEAAKIAKASKGEQGDPGNEGPAR